MNVQIKKMITYVIGVTALVLIDQLTKLAAVANLRGKDPFVIIDGVFEFSYLRNSGAAWGMMNGKRVFFIIITIIIIIILAYVMFKMPATGKYIPTAVVITMLSAGAIGNFIDRLINGYVHDFIYFKLINFPVFNVADMYVTISVFVFIVLILFVYKEEDFSFLSLKKDKK